VCEYEVNITPLDCITSRSFSARFCTPACREQS